MDLSGSIVKELKLGDVLFYGDTVIMDGEERILALRDIWNGNSVSEMVNWDAQLSVVNIR